MFERVVTGDMRIIARGLFLLLVIVVIGIGVAEHQLTTLTQHPYQERFFYISRNQDHVYSAYAFGYGLTLGSIHSLGQISVTNRNITLLIGNHSISIPTKIEINGSRIWYWLDVWHRQFVDEAFATKKKLVEYWYQVKPYTEAVLQALREQAQSVKQGINEYIREYR